MAGAYQLQEETVEQRVRVVAVSGDLDMAAAPAFEERLLEAVTQEGPVILDLSAVVFMDSKAIGAMISVSRKANLDRGRFAVVSRPGDIRRMLQYTGLDGAFDVYESRQEALASLASF